MIKYALLLLVVSMSSTALSEQCVEHNFDSNSQVINIDKCKSMSAENDSTGEFGMGLAFFSGQAVPKDNRLAVKWFRKSANQDHHTAMVGLGLALLDSGNYKEALKWLDRNHILVSWMSPILFKHVKDIVDNKSQTGHKIYHSVEAGQPTAISVLGVLFNLTSKNTDEYNKWHQKAAELGMAESQYHLGSAYIRGSGVLTDEKVGAQWMYKSAKQGYAKSQSWMGRLYFFGTGVPQDYKRSFKWYKKAAQQGVKGAQFKLAVQYLYGKGVETDEEEAFNWVIKAAKNDHHKSMHLAGLMLIEGTGTLKDLKEAKYWVKKAYEGYDKEVSDAAKKTWDEHRLWKY